MAAEEDEPPSKRQKVGEDLPWVCYYVLLGVPRDAGERQIKAAYRKRALQWHPDKNRHRAAEATKRFCQIGEAYSVLSSPERRALYDKYGQDWVDHTEGGIFDFSFDDARELFWSGAEHLVSSVKAAMGVIWKSFLLTGDAASEDDVKMNAAQATVNLSDSDKAAIDASLCECPTFQHLDSAARKQLAQAMTLQTAAASEVLFSEGDKGENFYIVRKGEVEIVKRGEVLATLGAGKTFGERSLLLGEGNGRQASARVSKTGGGAELWTLRKEVFKSTLHNAGEDGALLRREPALAGLPEEEVRALAVMLEWHFFQKDEVIIREGAEDDKCLYILTYGHVNVSKSGSPSGVLHPGPDGYFGEVALLRDRPRSATVIAGSEEVWCLSLSRSNFESNVLGSLKARLAARLEEYHV